MSDATEFDTLTAAVRDLRDRPAGLPASCNEWIAQIMERVIEEIEQEGPLHQFAGCEEAVVVLACAVVGEPGAADGPTARDALLRALREEHHPEYWGGERDEAGLVAAFEAEVLSGQAAELEQAEIAFEKRGQTITRLEGKLQAAEGRLADLVAWQWAYIEAHPETGTLDLIEATAKELT